MGDYASGHLTIHATVPEDVPALLAFIEQHQMAGNQHDPEGAVLLGISYDVDETSIMLVHDANLHTEAPRTTYTLWIESTREYSGMLEIHTPGLGLFSSDCDNDGSVIVPGQRIRDLVRDPQGAGISLEQLCGDEWLTAIEALGDVRGQVAANYRLDAHREPRVISVDEDSDRGADVRWAAFCEAEKGPFICGWKGPWRHADQFVGAANRHNAWPGAVVPTDPGQLAYEQAESDGKEHLKEEGTHG